MEKLANLQRAFIEAIQPQASTSDTAKIFISRPPLSNEARLQIYRHNISGGQIRALQSTFPVLAKILGQSNFSKLARNYAWSIGSPTADLNTLGHRLPAFINETLGNQPEFTALPYLADLAELEWAWSQAHLAASDPPFDLHAFQSAAENEHALHFQASKALSLLSSAFAVLELWHHQRNAEAVTRIEAQPSHSVVWRAIDHVVHAEALSPDEATVLNHVLSGDSLSVVIEKYPNIPVDTYLPKWVANGWLLMRENHHA